MTRRSIVRVLLSLLLLLSQQMAMSHAMMHWIDAARVHHVAKKANGVSSAFVQDQTCEQCLVFAQIAGAIGCDSRSFTTGGFATCALGSNPTQPGCERTICAFQSHAPPSFA